MIPWGQTHTYQWLAEQIGRPSAVRAVGQANHKNPIAIIVPCHRIIQTDGQLGGYAGGMNLKTYFLSLEHHRMAHQTTLGFANQAMPSQRSVTMLL